MMELEQAAITEGEEGEPFARTTLKSKSKRGLFARSAPFRSPLSWKRMTTPVPSDAEFQRIYEARWEALQAEIDSIIAGLALPERLNLVRQ
jgi:hypothetical protein